MGCASRTAPHSFPMPSPIQEGNPRFLLFRGEKVNKLGPYDWVIATRLVIDSFECGPHTCLPALGCFGWFASSSLTRLRAHATSTIGCECGIYNEELFPA